MINDVTFDGQLRLWWTEEGKPMVEMNKDKLDLESFIDVSNQLKKFLEVSDDHKI